MKEIFSPHLLPPRALLLTCSSHEARCRGLLERLGGWKPVDTALFHYDDDNPRREENQKWMVSTVRAASHEPTVFQFTESRAVQSLRDNMPGMRSFLNKFGRLPVVLDISVFTKRHLLMLLQWLDDEGIWERLTVVYSAPDDYDVSEYLPLSSGLASFRQIPGFSACADLSRPVHLVLFLGYEGDRALAVYEHVQPMDASLVVPYPPYNPDWAGRTEAYNAELLSLVGGQTKGVDPVDPEAAREALLTICGEASKRARHAQILCPLGTKPQAFGMYAYIRECADPPTVVYASPLRHNHNFYSHGIADSWLIRRASSV
jgi:hypothetical protein